MIHPASLGSYPGFGIRRIDRPSDSPRSSRKPRRLRARVARGSCQARMTVESLNRLKTTRYKPSSLRDQATHGPASKTRYRTRIEHEHEHEHDFENQPICQQPTTNNQQPTTTNHQPPTTNHQPPTTNPLPTPTPKLRALRAFVVKPPRARHSPHTRQKNSPSVTFRVLPWPTDARHPPKKPSRPSCLRGETPARKTLAPRPSPPLTSRRN
jgi:hypothetical protein